MQLEKMKSPQKLSKRCSIYSKNCEISGLYSFFALRCCCYLQNEWKTKTNVSKIPCYIFSCSVFGRSRVSPYFSGCFWLVKRTNLLSKQNISLASNGDWKKKHSPANCVVMRLTFAEWRSSFTKKIKYRNAGIDVKVLEFAKINEQRMQYDFCPDKFLNESGYSGHLKYRHGR